MSRDSQYKDLSHLENLDRVSRERWSVACAYMFIKKMPSEAIIAVANGGYDRWASIARPVYDGHGFKFEDFRRMFDIIKADAERRAQVRIHN